MLHRACYMMLVRPSAGHLPLQLLCLGTESAGTICSSGNCSEQDVVPSSCVYKGQITGLVFTWTALAFHE